MNYPRRTAAALLALFAMTALLAGCVKLRMNFLILSDKSGKFSVVLALRNDVFNNKFGNKKNSVFTLDDFEKNKGVVAWLRPKLTKAEGYHYIEVTGYFDDINNVKFSTFWPQISYAKKEDGNYLLKFTTSIKGDKATDDNKATRDFFKDVQLVYNFKLPGKVEPTKKWKVQGREAILNLDVEDILDVQNKNNGMIKAEIACEPPDEKTSEKDLEAFKKELELAKKEWAQYRKELEKQEEK